MLYAVPVAGALALLFAFLRSSWINKQDRWYEGDPDLVTAYALLALVYCN